MAKKIYVGNLSFQTTDADLNDMFSEVGQVESVQIITDRDTGRSKGFGFVEMSDDEAAAKAIERLNLLHFALHLRAVALDDDQLLAAFDSAIVDSSDADAADVVVVLDRADAHLEHLVHVAVRRGNVLEQRFKHRRDILARLFKVPACGSGSAGGSR